MIRKFDNRWNFTMLYNYDGKKDGNCCLSKFVAESARTEKGGCENVLMYDNIPIMANWYDKNKNYPHYGEIYSAKYGGENMHQSFGMIEHYSGDTYE